MIMKKKKFYYLLLKEDETGVLYAPQGTDTRFGERILPVENYEDMTFELRNGTYAPFMNSNVAALFASEELKQFLEENIPQGYPLEFLPIKVISEEFGDRLYYIIHFTTVFDVIDEVHSKRIPMTGDITVPCLKYEKVKELDFFNSTYSLGGIFISDRLKKMMKKKGVDIGLIFRERDSY